MKNRDNFRYKMSRNILAWGKQNLHAVLFCFAGGGNDPGQRGGGW